MSKLVPSLFLAAAILACCGTQPDPAPQEETLVPTSASTSLERGSAVINESITDIARTSPESLRRAMERLSASEAGSSDRGAELVYVASQIRAVLYPLLEPPDVTVLPPSPASVFPRLFDEIREGRFPDVPQEEASFLTLVIPPLAILHTTDSGVRERSILSLEQALVLNPDSVLPHYLLGVAAEENGDPDRGYERYREALSVASSCYPAQIGLARIEIGRGEYRQAAQRLEPLNASLPPDAEILGLLAEATFRAGDAESASTYILRAIQLSRDDMSLVLLRAEILYALGLPDPARSLLTIVEDAMPDQKRVLLLRTRLLVDAGQRDQALQVISRARDLYPESTEFDELYGKLLIESGNSAQGRAVLEDTLSESPDRIESLNVLLEDAMRQQEWEAAKDYIDRILENTNEPAFLQSAARVYGNLGETEAAVEFARRFYDETGEDTDSALLYARFLIENGNRERASEVLDRAINAAEDQEKRSRLYVLKSEITDGPREKVLLLGEALMDSPQNVEALIRISEAYEEMGEYGKALQWLRQAAALRPDDESLQQKVIELRRQAGG